MRFLSSTLLMALAAAAAALAERQVYAHYMLGLTSGQTGSEWANDIAAAKSAGIDGFALNAGPSDSYSEEQLGLAYAAAEQAGFGLFISFDMACCGPWSVSTVADWINRFRGSSAQVMVEGKPMVSTFEGPDFAIQWPEVERLVGDIFLVPDWSSLGPEGIRQHLDKIDGAFSWDAWSPNAGKKSNESDVAYVNVLGGKAYMMGVSPTFYTNLPIWNKNWLWGPDTLWYDRWEQVIDLQPEYVEIISWNDYGESHYIGPQRRAGIISQALPYVDGIPHEAWLFSLPYYTAAYKTGTRDVPIDKEGAVFWYRTAPKNSGSDGDTTLGPGGAQSARDGVEDAVYVLTLSNTDTTVHVKIGGAGQQFEVRKGAQLVSLPFDGRTGEVTVEINGKAGIGSAQITSGPASGAVNFNPVVARTAE